MASFSAPGTGTSPFILPEGSQAADRLLQTIDYNQKVNRYNQQQKFQQAQNLAKSYNDNVAKATYGTLWQDELNGLFQKHMEQGQKYAQQGFDVYSPNPGVQAQVNAHNQLMNDRRNLYSLQDTRDQMQKEFLEDQNLLAKAPAGKYDPASIKAQHDFIANHTLQDIYNQHLQLPRIQEAFDANKEILPKLNDAISMTGEQEYEKGGHKITTNLFKPQATQRNIEGLFQASPGGEQFVQQQTGLTPEQGRMMPSTIEDISKLNDSIFRGTQQGREFLANAGITSYNDPKYQQLLQQKSLQDYQNKQKYDQFMKSYVDMARSRAKEVNKNVTDWEGLNYGLSVQREKRLEAKENGDNEPVVFGNQESNVPVIKEFKNAEGKTVNGLIGHDSKGDPIYGASTVEPEAGATLFTQNFPQIKMVVTPGTYVNLENGHSIRNVTPFEVTAGSVKMEPVWQNLDAKDSRNGAVMSKRQLEEIVSGKAKGVDLSNLGFNPMVYADRPVKDKNTNKITYKPIAFPYDAVRGNSKVKTANFDKIESQFNDFLQGDTWKSMDANQRLEYLKQQFNIK